MKKHINNVDEEPLVIDGTEYRGDYYDTINWRVGTQQEVADAWALGKIPVKKGEVEFLTSSSRNFKGFHNPDGTGRLKHYSTTEAIRTKTLLIISNTECWSRGFAHCSTPSLKNCPNGYAYLPLSTWSAKRDMEHSMYDIVDYESFSTSSDGYDRIATVYDEDEGEFFHYKAGDGRLDPDPLSDKERRKFIREVSQ